MKKKTDDYFTRINKKRFIIHICFFSFFLLLFIGCFIGLATIRSYPSKDKLTYENCTFLRYELKRSVGVKSGTTAKYLVYVEEYNKPLEIDNIVIKKANKEALQSLEEKDVIQISRRDYNLYSASVGDTYILRYEDYLYCHNTNNLIGYIVVSSLILICSGMLVADIIVYKKTGETMPL